MDGFGHLGLMEGIPAPGSGDGTGWSLMSLTLQYNSLICAKLAPVQERAFRFIDLMTVLSPTFPFRAAISLVLKEQHQLSPRHYWWYNLAWTTNMNSFGSKTETIFVPVVLTASMFTVQNLGLPVPSYEHLVESMFIAGIWSLMLMENHLHQNISETI